jgi:hypothetical protein
VTGLSTLPETDGLRLAKRGRVLRWVFTAALVMYLLVAMLFLAGPKTRTVKRSAGDIELQVRYTARARPALPIRWEVQVRRAGGFHGKSVTLATTSSYFDLLDGNSGFDPQPESSTNDGTNAIWQLEPPPGDVLTFSFDGRVEPGMQLSWVNATTSVLEGGRPVVSAHYRTLVLP